MAVQLHISERLLQRAVNKMVSERLGTIGRDLGELTKGMTDTDAKEAKLMVLEMVRAACGDFYTKMKTRIESNKKDQSE